MRSITKTEQETYIRWDAEEQTAHIDTANPATIRKLDKLTEEYPEAYKCVRVDTAYLAKWYTVPASLIRFGKPVSQERRERARQNALVNGYQKLPK